MNTKVVQASAANAIHHAADVLKNGGVVAFPTDTVYGLGAMAFDEEGIDRLYFIKGRNHAKAIAVLLSDIEELKKVTPKPSKQALALARRFWPGPLTLVVPRLPEVPAALSPSPTIGVRIPDHPIALELLRLAGPLGVTSANLSGGENSNSAEEVLAQMDGRIHLVLDGGKTPGGVPSTVVDLTGPEAKVLRQGPLSEQDLEAEIG